MLWLVALIQTFLFVISAPLLLGMVKWVKCQLQNRQAPSIFQGYKNLRKLFCKEVIIADTTSSLFRIVPYLIFALTVLCSAIVPLFLVNTPTTAIADVIVFVGLLGLVRFFLTLAGLDAGTMFGGMGASREMLIAVSAEPALLMVLFAVAMNAQSTNLAVIIQHFITMHLFLHPSIIFAAMGLAVVAVAETGRIPVDNPATHLELTMIHEAMILEYSGRYLALLEWAAQIKFMLYAVLLINLFFPFGIALNFSWLGVCFSIFVLILKLLVLVIVLGITEISLAKFRLFRAPYLLNLAFILALLAILIHIILEVQ